MGLFSESTPTWSDIAKVELPSRVVDFPRTNTATGKPFGQLVLVTLPVSEIAKAHVAANDFATKAAGAEKGAADRIYTNEVAVQLIARAARRVDDPKLPFFPSADELRAGLSTDELTVLFEQYGALSDLGPIKASLTEREAKQWIDAILAGGSGFPLEALAAPALRALVNAFRAEVEKLRGVH